MGQRFTNEFNPNLSQFRSKWNSNQIYSMITAVKAYWSVISQSKKPDSVASHFDIPEVVLPSTGHFIESHWTVNWDVF
jgi:hypothetical protein